MSAKISTEHKTKHVETHRVHPDDITEGRNSRMIAAPNYPDTVRSLAVSIAKHGQLQPAEARRIEGNTLELVSGYTRRDAIKALREGFTAIDPDTGEETEFHDPDAMLWVRVETNVSADEAFLRSIKENQDRHDTTDLQEAEAQNELRTTMGWSDTKIARFYGYTNQNRVMALEKLLRMPKETRAAVHEGRMALSIATLAHDSPITDEERVKIIEEATTDGKVSGPALKNLLRDLLSVRVDLPIPPSGGDTDEGGDPKEPAKEPKTPSIKRSVKDLERFLTADAESDSPEVGTAGAEFLGVLLLWFAGKRNDAYLTRTINEYLR